MSLRQVVPSVLEFDRLFSCVGTQLNRETAGVFLLAVKNGFKFGNQVLQALLRFSHRLFVTWAFVRQVVYGFAIPP